MHKIKQNKEKNLRLGNWGTDGWSAAGSAGREVGWSIVGLAGYWTEVSCGGTACVSERAVLGSAAVPGIPISSSYLNPIGSSGVGVWGSPRMSLS